MNCRGSDGLFDGSRPHLLTPHRGAAGNRQHETPRLLHMTIDCRSPQLAASSIGHFRDPLPGFPAGQPYASDITPGGLLDIPAARSWFSRVDLIREAEAYTFALPLDRSAGATSGSAGT